MSNQVRRLPASDIAAWVEQMTLGFHHHLLPDEFSEYFLGVIDLERTWAAYDGDRVVGTLRSFATELTVPGPEVVKAAALTNVTVAPTHRRQGLLTGMITSDLRASKEKGEAVGMLIASEWPIYGRYGYGPAVHGARYEIDTAALGWRSPSQGQVELVDRATIRVWGQKIYDTWRRRQLGAMARSDHWWDRATNQVEVPGDEPPKERNALYRSPSGQIEGYLRYETNSDWEGMRPQGMLRVRELVALNPEAEQCLWDFCCSVDLLRRVEASDRAVDDVVALLVADGRHVKATMVYDFVWLRILDTVAALEGRRYRSEGRIVLEVLDALGLAGGRYLLDAGPGGASCRPTEAEPELSMPVDTLGSAYLGGETFARLQAAGRLEENKAGAVERADVLFATSRAPWCNTWF